MSNYDNEYQPFLAGVNARFTSLSRNELYTVDVPDLFGIYLDAFPEGTNPIFRERRVYDCSTCRNFINHLGNVVSLVEGTPTTVWDLDGLSYPFTVVAEKMSEAVRSASITSVFRSKITSYGSDRTPESETGIVWRHFHGTVASRHRANNPDQARGQATTTANMLTRALTELTPDAITTAIDLIQDPTAPLYRGHEFLRPVEEFGKLHEQHVSAPDQDVFVWSNVDSPVARIRNTAIGTLLVDLSEGMDVEGAVRRFESVVAPTNYQRTTAPITKRAVENAVAQLQTLGLEHAVKRRYARITDVSVNNVLFVDNTVRPQMRDGLTELLMEEVKPGPVRVKDPTPITMNGFMAEVVPLASSIEVLVTEELLPQFVSLTAPEGDDTGRLFKWDNDFAWSYDGEVTDSIKSRVKAAGGKTGALLRCSLAWFNFDDLDIHAHTPSGKHIYFSNKAGVLDVDMNVGPERRDAVENLSWSRIEDGKYDIKVNNYTHRESIDVGFTLEVEYQGKVTQYAYRREVRGTVHALTLSVENGALVRIETHTGVEPLEMVPAVKWGVTTGQFATVDTLMSSPNFWDGRDIGNKHWFFILKGCKNPGETRGFYNEFLRPELHEHRKVFEVLGAKIKCSPTDDQLSGLGFSSTRKDEVTVVAKGASLNRAYRIQF